MPIRNRLAELHHPEYDFRNDVTPVGCSYWVDLAEARLSGAQA